MALTPFRSRLIADVGLSLGDEGKGRLIPEVAAELREATGRADAVGVVLKVNGGANAGHTAAGLKLNLVPSGAVLVPMPFLAIGSGVVADPRKFLWELAYLGLHGVDAGPRLRIDERTMVSDVAHRMLDLGWEDYRVRVLGEEPRGSTGRGISPAYADETSQFQITYAEFRGERAAYARRLRFRLERAAATLRHVCGVSEADFARGFDRLTEAELRANREAIEGGRLAPADVDFTRFRGRAPFSFDVEAVEEAFWAAGRALADRVVDVRELVRASLEEGRSVLGEHGQSYWLDKRHGFSPNVTASHTGAAELFQTAGLPVQPVHVMGVAKAYDTKVGTHLFLTRFEADHPLGQRLSRIEFGTSTGRQRMVGWFDAVEKGDALRHHGADDLMINKLDALSLGADYAGPLKIAVAYRDASGREWREVPRDDRVRSALKPVYREFEGWTEDVSGTRRWADLPLAARRYVAGMMASTIDIASRGKPGSVPLPNLRYLGVGPGPSQIIKDVPPTTELIGMVGGG